MPVQTQQEPEATRQDFPIVGIGASAGGFNAFIQLLQNITEDSGMAYVLVQHLDPQHNSILTELLSPHTKLPVLEITDDIHLAPNTIYVIPENKLLTSVDGVLKLNPRDLKKNELTIDLFFTSLAEVHLNLAVGVVLSGNGSDGTQGLEAIKLHGGVTFAQHPGAANTEMPQSAILAGFVDFSLPVAEIPGKLLEWNKQERDSPAGHRRKQEEHIFGEILHLLHQRSGVDFTYYKQTTIRRRITRRMAISKSPTSADYLHLLQKDTIASEALFNDLLIPVTEFFRDPKVFHTLRYTVLPALVKNIPASGSVRVWVAGCSTGEEAYSMAIALHDLLGNNPLGITIQVFASDISEPAIAKARRGSYKSTQVKNVPEPLLEKYFTRNNDMYVINREIRDLCIFAVHNFLKDPPFARMDLISCRNVLIYMDPLLQKKSLTTFHYALKESGFLLLGKSETTAPGENLFLPFEKGAKIYLRRQVSGHFTHTALTTHKTTAPRHPGKVIPEVQKSDFKKNAESILLSDHVPASVIVNEQMDVVQIYGEIDAFLSFSYGKPTLNLLKIAHNSLAFELRSAWHKVRETGLPLVKEGVRFKSKDTVREISFEFQPLTAAASPYFLIIFRQAMYREAPAVSDHANENDFHVQRIKQLEKELSRIHEDVNAISEEQELFNGELQTANEELLSGSEELQSLNEELETSREELQSSNEELVIINQELLNKQQEIISSRNYTKAIVDTLREPIVVLDEGLHIKNINRAFAKKFSITQQESEGKLIYEIQNHLFDNPALRAMLEKILPQKIRMDDYEITMNLLPYGESFFLLNAVQVTNESSKELLILLAVEDITERRTIEQRLKILSDGLELKVGERTADLVISNTILESTIRELSEANIQLHQFAYVASHDLQEPLRKIMLFISKLLSMEHTFSDETVLMLNKISSSSGRMKNLITDLLSYSYLSNHEDQFVPTDLNEILKNILLDFEVLLEEHKVELQTDLLPTIIAIPLHMNQLFYNLISNAIKFHKNDGTVHRIEVKSRILTGKDIASHPELSASRSYCEIIIQDNGIGFDKQYKDHIFTLFQRLHNKDTYTGTGIGLAIGKKIVDNHNGLIFSVAKQDDGAAFHVILPIT